MIRGFAPASRIANRPSLCGPSWHCTGRTMFFKGRKPRSSKAYVALSATSRGSVARPAPLRVCYRLPSYHAVAIQDPEETARTAKEKVRQGYKRLQLKIGNRPVEEDIECIQKVWEAVGYKARLAADGNRSFTIVDAMTLDRLCSNVPSFFEQPCQHDGGGSDTQGPCRSSCVSR